MPDDDFLRRFRETKFQRAQNTAESAFFMLKRGAFRMRKQANQLDGMLDAITGMEPEFINIMERRRQGLALAYCLLWLYEDHPELKSEIAREARRQLVLHIDKDSYEQGIKLAEEFIASRKTS